MAKIHTVEWTPAILNERFVQDAVNVEWFGSLSPQAIQWLIKNQVSVSRDRKSPKERELSLNRTNGKDNRVRLRTTRSRTIGEDCLKPKLNTNTKPKPKPNTNTKPNPKSNTNTKPNPKPNTNTKPNPKPNTNTKPNPKKREKLRNET